MITADSGKILLASNATKPVCSLTEERLSGFLKHEI